MSAPVTHTAAATPSPVNPAPEGGAYAVKLAAFEGPLDLLLHLIRLNEVEITDIPIAQIAEQYLEYLELMRELNLDIAGEYLVMAATLAWIKSRMLLPPDPSEGEDDILDPRAELMARLLEYQRFKEAATDLGERPLLGRDVYPAHAPELEGPDEAEREIEVGIFQLVEALRQALRHAGPSGAAHEVEVETVTVRERMIAVMESLTRRESCDFVELVTKDGEWAGREIIVATFLAILELTRLAAIGLYQGLDDLGVPQGPIHVRRIGDADDRNWAERISEFM
ncbi:MAG TPA: segregation/condensation protein A [Myxococcota bacterium]